MGRGRWWAAAISAIATAAGGLAVGRAADTCVVVDQRNLVSDGNIVVQDTQIPGQTFVAGLAGQLVGIEVAPLIDTITPTTIVSLDLYDATDRLIGSVSRTAMGFPPGGGAVPAPLVVDAIATGYFDVTPLAVIVTPGTALGFRIRHDQPRACNLETETCVGGISAGEHCWDAWDCPAQMRLGMPTGNSYPGGALMIDLDGVIAFDPDADLAFKTFVADPTLCATPTETASAPTATPIDVPTPTATATGPCPAEPSDSCLQPERRRSAIAMQTRRGERAESRLRWKWRGWPFPVAALGDPSAAPHYALCLYDVRSLLAAIPLPTDEACATCWHPGGVTFRDGRNRLALDAARGTVAVRLERRDADVPLPPTANFAGPVEVRLTRTGDAECWGATFRAPFEKYDARAFVDRSE